MIFGLPPQKNIAEITLIGTGGGYGESVVIHLGSNNWIVIDSCIDPVSKESLPLIYLNSLGVNLKEDVKLVICTHWHNDHILGLSQIVEKCESCVFCMARPNDLRKFLQLVELDYRKINIEASNSSTIEFKKCMDIIKQRNPNLRKNAEVDKTLLSLSYSDTITSEVISLSPSDFTMNEFDMEISTLITEYGPSSKKIIAKDPNSKSVVIFLKIGSHRAILGADLEVKETDKEGWIHILDHSQLVEKSTLFKIPHHGSSNGYHKRIWTELLHANPISKLTPWNRKTKLPNAEMIQKYTSHSDSLFMTSPHMNDKPKNRDRKIEKIIKKMNLKIKEVKYARGVIQNRINIEDENDNWHTSLYENSFHVNSQIA